jgi:hypothetical protein
MSDEIMARVQTIKSRYEKELLSKRNVVGVGIGLCQRSGQEQVCIVVSVRHKMPLTQLAPRDVVPRTLDGVPVDVQETGAFRAF